MILVCFIFYLYFLCFVLYILIKDKTNNKFFLYFALIIYCIIKLLYEYMYVYFLGV